MEKYESLFIKKCKNLALLDFRRFFCPIKRSRAELIRELYLINVLSSKKCAQFKRRNLLNKLFLLPKKNVPNWRECPIKGSAQLSGPYCKPSSRKVLLLLAAAFSIFWRVGGVRPRLDLHSSSRSRSENWARVSAFPKLCQDFKWVRKEGHKSAVLVNFYASNFFFYLFSIFPHLTFYEGAWKKSVLKTLKHFAVIIRLEGAF